MNKEYIDKEEAIYTIRKYPGVVDKSVAVRLLTQLSQTDTDGLLVKRDLNEGEENVGDDTVR